MCWKKHFPGMFVMRKPAPCWRKFCSIINISFVHLPFPGTLLKEPLRRVLFRHQSRTLAYRFLTEKRARTWYSKNRIITNSLKRERFPVGDKGGREMTREEIEKKIAELKSDYVRIQSDLEKATYVGSNTSRGEEVLTAIETELRQLRQLLRTMESSADSIGKRKF